MLCGLSSAVEVGGNRILNGASPNLPHVRACDTVDLCSGLIDRKFDAIALQALDALVMAQFQHFVQLEH